MSKESTSWWLGNVWTLEETGVDGAVSTYYTVPIGPMWAEYFPGVDLDGDTILCGPTGSAIGEMPWRSSSLTRKKWRRYFIDSIVSEFAEAVLSIEYLTRRRKMPPPKATYSWLIRAREAYDRVIGLEGYKVNYIKRWYVNDYLKKFADLVIFGGLSEVDPELTAWLLEKTKGLCAEEEEMVV